MGLKTISLRSRLILLVITISGPLVIAMIYLLTQNAGNHIKHEADETLRLSGRSLASTTQSWLDFHTRALSQLVNNPEVMSMNPKRQKPQLELMARSYRHMYLVSTIDIKGTNMARSDNVAPIDYQDRFWFRSAVKGNSPVFQSLIGRTSKQPALIVSMPIKNGNGAVVGVGMFAALLNELTTEVQATRIGKTGYAFVVDAENRVIAHPDSAYTAQLLDFGNEPPVAALRAGKRGIFEFTDERGKTWRCYIDTIKNGWGIIVRQDQSEIMQPLTDLRQLALLFLIVVPIILIALSWVMVRRAFRPVRILTDTATAIAEGDLTRKAPLLGDDEIGVLSRAFNTMTERLRQVIADLEKRIEEKEEAQAAQRESEAKYRMIVDTANEGIWMLDKERRTIFVNNRMSEMLGYSKEEMMERNVDSFAFEEDLEDHYRRMEKRRNGIPEQYERRWRHKNGDAVWTIVAAKPIFDPEKRHNGSFAMITDITQRKYAEDAVMRLNEELEQRVIERTKQLEMANSELMLLTKQLQDALSELKSAQSRILQQEKMASIGQLAAGVAHEINNPMGFIIANLNSLERYMNKMIGYVQMQSEGLAKLCAENGNRGSEVMKAIEDNKRAIKLDYMLGDTADLIKESLEGAHRVKKIVQDLKSFSRVDQCEFKLANIHEGLDSTISIVWNEMKYKVELVKQYGDLQHTVCNLGQLNQVFMNLLVNAAQAIPDNGTVTIRTSSDGENICIAISDTGIGIPSDKISRIFEPFYTTKSVGQGTGLGLSIVYDIIKNHNGEIHVTSEVGRGTTFTILIPVADGN